VRKAEPQSFGCWLKHVRKPPRRDTPQRLQTNQRCGLETASSLALSRIRHLLSPTFGPFSPRAKAHPQIPFLQEWFAMGVTAQTWHTAP
jgi:hypothetical protein